jgi:phage-related protein
MLVGDVASPFIPVGIVGHGVAAVVGEGRILRIVDNIGEGGRIVKTKAGGVVEYVKDGIARFAKWFDDLGGFKRCIVKGTEHWSDNALDGLESIARAGGEGPEGKAVAEKFVATLTEEYGDGYVQKIAKGVNELQEREITGAGKVPTKIVEAKNSLTNLKGIAFEVEVATDSKYVDDVAEVRRDIYPIGDRKTDIDILLKNDDIIEAKNFDWSAIDRKKFNDHKSTLGGQIRKFKNYQSNTLNNPDAEIKVVFKNEDSYWYPEMKAFLEDDKGVLVEVL